MDRQLRTRSAPGRQPALPFAAGAIAALGVFLLARAEAPGAGRYPGSFQLFFSDPRLLKAWFATVALTLAILQPLTAAWFLGKLPWRSPAWVAAFHRWNGRLVFAVTLPVAYLCVFELGFRATSDRVLVHALAGCTVYGAFVAKVLLVRLHGWPILVIAGAGGVLLAILLATWSTSALWLFRGVGLIF